MFYRIIRIICFVSISAISSFAKDAEYPLTLELKIIESPSGEFIVGEPVQAELAIKNTTDHLINFLPPLANSGFGRYPNYKWNIKRPLPSFYLPPELGWCGTPYPLQKRDFIPLPPGQSYIIREQYDSMDSHGEGFTKFTPYSAGIYTVSYAIQLNGTAQQYNDDYQPYDPSYTLPDEIQALWNTLPKIDLQSNTVTITVKSNNKTLDPKYHCLMGMPREEVKRMFFQYYLPEDFDTNPIASIRFRPNYYNVHFNDTNISDGVSVTSYNGFKDEFFLIARGKHTEIPYRIVNEKTSVTLLVGCFATSDVDGFEFFR